jgi:hypothetical protein
LTSFTLFAIPSTGTIAPSLTLVFTAAVSLLGC